MKVTNYMLQKWSKAILLIIFGIILLIYMEGVNSEITQMFEHAFGSQIATITLVVYIVYLVIILWCFIDAVLNLVTSFRENRITIDDLGAKLEAIERKVIEMQQGTTPMPQKPIIEEQAVVGQEPPVAPAPTPEQTPASPPAQPTSEVPPPPPQ